MTDPNVLETLNSIAKLIRENIRLKLPHYHTKQGVRTNARAVEIVLSTTPTYDCYHILFVTNDAIIYYPYAFQDTTTIKLAEPNSIQKAINTIKTQASKQDFNKYVPLTPNVYPLGF